MQTLLQGSGGNRILEGWSIHPEIAFEVPFGEDDQGDEALVGMMDRLEVNRSLGIIRIIDYKWTAGKKTPEQMRKHYQLQLELYAYAAIRLCGEDFPLKKLETKLIHLSEEGVRVIEVPVQLTRIYSIADDLLNRARSTLQKERKKQLETPVEGDYCRYCEFKRSCPAKK